MKQNFTALCLALFLAGPAKAEDLTPSEVLSNSLARIIALVEPEPGAPRKTFSARLEMAQGEGMPKALAGRSATLAYQAPDRLRLAATIDNATYQAGRNCQQVWIYSAAQKFGVVGSTNVPRFLTAPEKVDSHPLPPFKMPVPKEQLAILPLLLKLEADPPESLDQVLCYVVKATAQPQAVQLLKLPGGEFRLWIRQKDFLPGRIEYREGSKTRIQLDLHDLQLAEPWPAESWAIPSKADDHVETVAVSHLTRFLKVLANTLDRQIPSLGPATGARQVLATEGPGRLELVDGTKVLFVKGSPEAMGYQHGRLLKKQIRDLVDQILYGVGVGSSFAKGRWFFGEIESAQKRLLPFMNERYLREMDALAMACGLEKEEIRLANFFPELFHCSGFAVFGEATQDGHLYHGRILDYLRGLGLEQNAVVMVFQPDQGNAWVNISYAGFVGSVTAMNAKQVAIGEMGGRGEGNWDGKPMAQLMREVMEQSSSLDEALETLRKSQRTCEYYYVVSDAKTRKAAGIAATPTTFEVIWPGQTHPRLPHAIKDAVLMSAGDRYETLAARVKAQHGKLDAQGARDLMTRPVCMMSNIHSVLFAPDTLDFWVANADSKNVASHTRYTHYNLAEMLK